MEGRRDDGQDPSHVTKEGLGLWMSVLTNSESEFRAEHN